VSAVSDFLTAEGVRLTIYRKDGTSMSGRYSYLMALGQVEFAKTLPEYASYRIEVLE
jgi:hypothetical protein